MSPQDRWLKDLNRSPIEALLDFDDPALDYFTRRDLLGEDAGEIRDLWERPELEKLIDLQQADGSWAYPKRGKGAHPTENYHILQTFRTLGILVEMYGIDRSHPAISRAADYLLAQQSEEGDIRGIFGSQYAPHYTAGIIELIIKAGYDQDPRIKKAFQWYEASRQEDGGWAWPLRTTGISYQDAIELNQPVRSDLAQPFSHALTGFVIRAYAAHPVYRTSNTARKAGELLKSRFFKPDKYSDRRNAEYWLKFQFPFWWGSLLTAMDSLSFLSFSVEDPDIRKGLEWFQANQMSTGFWPTGYGKGTKTDVNQAWVALAVCRMMKRFE